MRYLYDGVTKDLARKMVFIGGPRQVGKTTLAQAVLNDARFEGGRYFNWDYDDDRRAVLGKRWAAENRLLVFDELHKYPKWKSWLKGVYDVSKAEHRFLVTGSARLDVYRRGGDSLLGRYHYWRLHPFTLDEYDGAKLTSLEALSRLLTVGGFPEPFLAGDATEARRWRRERFDRLLREDIRDLEPISNLQMLSLFVDALRQRVGGLVILSNIAGELQISPKTAKSWLEAVERMYLAFAVRPFTTSLPRAIQKPPKVYFYDNGDVIGEEGAIFENLVAASLLKRIHFREDRDGYRYELRYIRDKEGREVDFAIVKEGRIEELVEVKLSDEKPSAALKYYAERLKPKRATQLVLRLKRPYDQGRLRVTNPVSYFTGL
jgi:predicted AAA+ superfamily ATPase